MHIPDGFINGATSLGAGVLAAGGLGAALRRGSRTLKDRQIPLAGLVAAFVFALQMLNFPVAAGTSGHLLGGALAAVLLGPSMAVVAVSVVVIVQALLFADGGVSALGLNILNMGLLPALRRRVRAGRKWPGADRYGPRGYGRGPLAHRDRGRRDHRCDRCRRACRATRPRLRRAEV